MYYSLRICWVHCGHVHGRQSILKAACLLSSKPTQALSLEWHLFAQLYHQQMCHHFSWWFKPMSQTSIRNSREWNKKHSSKVFILDMMEQNNISRTGHVNENSVRQWDSGSHASVVTRPPEEHNKKNTHTRTMRTTQISAFDVNVSSSSSRFSVSW